jgi:glycosyltransferase involved in cell wall biosynthesis
MTSPFDTVVMLTVSDWASEPRSNRYHYATRFARTARVIFVQPDRAECGYHFSPSGYPGIEILHVSQSFDEEQAETLEKVLDRTGVGNMLLWVLNPNYGLAVENIKAARCVFHATEDYFQKELGRQLKATFYTRLAKLLGTVDLVVAVSEGVRNSYVRNGGYLGEVLVLENGCDYKFWQSFSGEIRKDRVALYQGGINYRLDAELISEIAELLPDWQFRFCGARDPRWTTWDELLARHPNVKDLGNLPPEAFARESWQATVGIIPFIQSSFIVDVSFPLKAFEYVACGLPVVTVPIRSLERWPRLFAAAADAKGFAVRIRETSQLIDDAELIRERAATAAQRDYDVTFERLMSFFSGGARSRGRIRVMARTVTPWLAWLPIRSRLGVRDFLISARNFRVRVVAKLKHMRGQRAS